MKENLKVETTEREREGECVWSEKGVIQVNKLSLKGVRFLSLYLYLC